MGADVPALWPAYKYSCIPFSRCFCPKCCTVRVWMGGGCTNNYFALYRCLQPGWT